MSTLQKKQLPEAELQRLGIDVVYLFGSRAEGVAGPSSDIDIGIVLNNPIPKHKPITALYNDVFYVLEDCFDMSNFRTMDIVFLQRASLELQCDVVRHGKVLFESSPETRMQYEERILLLYSDFRPLLQQFNEAVLERV